MSWQVEVRRELEEERLDRTIGKAMLDYVGIVFGSISLIIAIIALSVVMQDHQNAPTRGDTQALKDSINRAAEAMENMNEIWKGRGK